MLTAAVQVSKNYINQDTQLQNGRAEDGAYQGIVHVAIRVQLRQVFIEFVVDVDRAVAVGLVDDLRVETGRCGVSNGWWWFLQE